MTGNCFFLSGGQFSKNKENCKVFIQKRLVVEHDEHIIRHADYIIDVGPGAGIQGGQIVAQGTLDEIINNPDSATGRYLNHATKIELPARRREAHLSGRKKTHPVIETQGARANNLKSINVKTPLKTFCCVTGVSGSGKSTLVTDILHRSLVKSLYGSQEIPGEHDKIIGAQHVDKVIEIDQYFFCKNIIRNWQCFYQYL